MFWKSHLVIGSSWHQLVIGQLSYSRHSRPEVPAGRCQDVTHGDAGGLVCDHGVSIVAEVFQQCRGDHVQQLLPANGCVLFTEESTGDVTLSILRHQLYAACLFQPHIPSLMVTCVHFHLLAAVS